MTLRDYPSAICHDCGMKYGRRAPHIACYHTSECDLCGQTASLTEPRDYGHLNEKKIEKELKIKFKKLELTQELKDLSFMMNYMLESPQIKRRIEE
jgi:tRNA G26 N,N-dimethylase Trm1